MKSKDQEKPTQYPKRGVKLHSIFTEKPINGAGKPLDLENLSITQGGISMEATNSSPKNQDKKTKKDSKTLSREVERQLQDENLKVYHQLLWAEEQINQSR